MILFLKLSCMYMKKKLILAHTGNFNGQHLTKKMLNEMVQNFPHDGVPICIGHHPQAQTPKLGKVVDLALEGDQLIGTVDMHDELARAFDQGFFDSWSIGAQKGARGWYLHHLALLGEEPAAIKDLKKRTQDFLGIAASDTMSVIYFNDMENDDNAEEDNQVDKAGTSAQIGQLLKRLQILEQELKDKDDMIQSMGQAMLDNDMAALEQAMRGKAPHNAQVFVRELLNSLKHQNFVNMSDAQQPIRLLKGFFDAMPKQVQTGRVNLGESEVGQHQIVKKGAI
jgi:hypothetical protein